MKDLVLTQFMGVIQQQSSRGKGAAVAAQDGQSVHIKEVELSLELNPAEAEQWKALEVLFPFCKRMADLIAGDDGHPGMTLVAQQKLPPLMLRVYSGNSNEPILVADQCSHKGKAKLLIDDDGEGIVTLTLLAKFPSVDAVNALVGADVRVTLVAQQVTVQHAAEENGQDEAEGEGSPTKKPKAPRRKKNEVLAKAAEAMVGYAKGRLGNASISDEGIDF